MNKSSKDSKLPSRPNGSLIYLLIFGSLLLIFSLAMLLGGFGLIIRFFIQSKLQISPGTDTETDWINTPIPLYMNVYMFNITNPEEFQKGSKPILQEIGPYVYREFHRKENIIYYKNMTVSFSQNRWWIWDQERSGDLRPTDLIYAVNIIPVTAAFGFEGSEILLTSLNSLMQIMKEKLIVKVTVSQILFEGYKDPLLDFMKVLANSRMGFPLNKGLLGFDKFGWFYKSNNTVEKIPINMFTGESGVQDIGQINWFDYSNRTKFFDPPCNEVLGSAGELWPPGYSEDFIQLYFAELCMSPKLYYLKDVRDSFGNPGRRYWGSSETFANSTYIPSHKCFCVHGKCGPNGLLDAQTCRMGSPTYMSFPHFFNADEALLKNVEGVKPNSNKHIFYLDINPELGLPLEVAARLQMNIEVKPYPGKQILNIGRIDMLANVPSVILPAFWFEVLGHLTKRMSDEAQLPIVLMSSNVPYFVFGSLLAISLLLILFVIWRILTNTDWRRNATYNYVKAKN